VAITFLAWMKESLPLQPRAGRLSGWLFDLTAAGSSLLFAASIASLMLDPNDSLIVGQHGYSHEYRLTVVSGIVIVWYANDGLLRAPIPHFAGFGWYCRTRPASNSALVRRTSARGSGHRAAPAPLTYQRFAFHTTKTSRLPATIRRFGNGVWVDVRCPIWCLVLASITLPTAWMSVLVRRCIKARQAHGVLRCRQCGYDLRATPERCPECGTAPVGI
jgi:hypothetical protein